MSTVVKTDSKVYIAGVRKINWDTGEMCEFASALVSALRALGEPADYSYVMGVSGAAFRFTLNPGEWDFGNYGIRNIALDPDEPVRRALEATGREYTLCAKTTWQEDAAAIMGSIDRGIPVLAYPVVGPSDCTILTGYDEGGDVLLGWSTYQDIPDDHNIPHDETGYFRKPGWHDNLGGYILLGAPKEPRPRREIYLEALRWAVHLMRMPGMGTKATGLEGLRVWAEEMMQDQFFPKDDEGLIGWRYVSAAINMTMLRDHCSAEPFLRQIGTEFPEFQPELARAAASYSQMMQIRARMDDLIGDNFSEQAMKAIHDPEIRRAYAAAILEIRAQEEEAVGALEELIQRCA